VTINLEKGQKISLDKEAGSKLTRITMGLGWDALKSKGIFGFGGSAPDIDLDASCILFDSQGNVTDSVWFRQLHSRDGSVIHTGDNRTGDGDGDDEQILVDLERVPDKVKSLVFTVNSFTGQNFSQIENASCRILNSVNGKEIACFNLTGLGSHNAQIMAKIYRHGDEWKMHAIGEIANGRTFDELLPKIKLFL
jgi:tellurium resistance protein TerZ